MTTQAQELVLVVEDETSISDLLHLYLSKAGFRVHHEVDGYSGLIAARSLSPAAIVLDVGLPGMDGTEVCRSLREEGNWVPILFCTARDEEIDRVRGLELGGDDYITKPFSPRELVARVRSAVRRASGPTERYSVGSVTLDRVAHRVTLDGQEVSLTTTEFDLLAYLMARPDRVVTREELLDKVWGYPPDVGTRTADVHVAQLRHKLGPQNPIRTVRGVGYCVESSSA